MRTPSHKVTFSTSPGSPGWSSGLCTTRLEQPGHCNGSVLILVLVIVAVLTLGAYTFSELMISEVEATSMFGRQADSRAFADSGVELVAALVANPESVTDENLYHNPERFQSLVLRETDSARGRGMFSVVAPVESDPSASSVRFGVSDESAKINLNALAKLGLDEVQTRQMLLYLPNMTEDVADAILDWLDEDDVPREFGVEFDYYESLTPPYEPANGALQSLDELLQISGVTPELLYGEDANRNGLLDPNENDGDASPPFDNGDGILQLGWNAFLTIDSKESNLRADGTQRIYLNDGVLTDLFDKIAEEYDEDVAKFVVAFRMNGPRQDPNQKDQQDQDQNQNQNSGQSGQNQNSNSQNSNRSQQGSNNSGNNQNSNQSQNSNSRSNNSSGGGSNNSSNSSNSNNSSSGNSSNSNQQPSSSQLAQAANSLGKAVAGGIEGAVTRAGLDLTGGAKVEVKSLYELIGAQVEVQVNGQPTILESPWALNTGEMQSYLPDLLDRFTSFKGDAIEGRINVNQARLEALLGLPDMTEQIAQGIVGSSVIGADGQPLVDEIGQRSNTGWLLTQGIVDLPTMVKLDRYLTARGTVVRAQVVGYFEQGGGYTRIEAVIDATKPPAKILNLIDLTDLGRGYSTDLLRGMRPQGAR